MLTEIEIIHHPRVMKEKCTENMDDLQHHTTLRREHTFPWLRIRPLLITS